MADNRDDKLVTAGGLKKFYENLKTYITKEVEKVDISSELDDYYSKGEIEGYLANKADSSSITTINKDIGDISSKVNALESKKSYSYDVSYGSTIMEATGEEKDNVFTFYEIEDDTPIIKQQFQISGGGGGPSTSSTITIERLEGSGLVGLKDDEILNIKYNFKSIDASGDDTGDATAVWKIDGSTVYTETISQGVNSFNIRPYLTVGTFNIVVGITDTNGSYSTKNWNVRVIDLSLDASAFDDKKIYPQQNINFIYTPTGMGVSKTVYFYLDGNLLGTEIVEASGRQLGYTIPSQTQGSHLLDVYMKATVNGTEITTPHIYKDIIFKEDGNKEPVISCRTQEIEAEQYNTIDIEYTVYDPNTNSPKVSYYINDNKISEVTLAAVDGIATSVWSYQFSEPDTYNLKICRDWIDTAEDGSQILKTVSKNIIVNVNALSIDITPVSTGLVMNFNPIGYSNNDLENRLWSNEQISMTVSDNFDWNNGGYQIETVTKDDYGEILDTPISRSCFVIKAGTWASFDYKMFSGTPTNNITTNSGSEMKIIFKTENVQTSSAVWFTNTETTTSTDLEGIEYNKTIGIQLGVHEGWLKTNTALEADVDDDNTASNSYLYLPYSEEDIIELDIDISPLGNQTNAYVMGYEDGVPSKAFIYGGSDNFYQTSPKDIKIGSPDCDVKIYLLKIYNNSLTTDMIMQNFIADAYNSEEMLNRYYRNSIYYNSETKEFSPYASEGKLIPERFAEACPDLKVLMLEAPSLTQGKKYFVKNSSLRCIHKNGDPVLDNWKFINGYHSGQGTTSDNYGISGRNLDFLFNVDGVHKCSDKVDLDPDYVSSVTFGFDTENAVTYTTQDANDVNDPARITLTRNSFPTNFLNLKVNIASSENANNAVLQKRYNDFLPYKTLAAIRDSRIKNDMEFVPAVIFIKETGDATERKAFNDNEWHFYALGNIGDSKKTDYTRAYDPTDMNEFTLEISDNTRNNATFQSGVYLNEAGERTIEAIGDNGIHDYIYPITNDEWNENNQRYHYLYTEAFDGDHSFEPRYACCGDYRDGKFVDGMNGVRTKTSDAIQLAKNQKVWYAFYRWVITSTDEEFVKELNQWCNPKAVEFFYLFTHNWTMMDNRAKNTFWHFGKTGEFKKASKPVEELLHIYCEKQSDGTYITTEDISINPEKDYYTEYAFDLWDYDNDTALGINNNGELIFPYGKEDVDYQIENEPNSGYIFNGAQSGFWCRLRDLCSKEMEELYKSISNNCWNAKHLIKEFDIFQNTYPEEVWRLDIERKYLRTFSGKSIDSSKEIDAAPSYLKNMMQGRKKYQRRQWTKNQSMYFATKYLSADASATNIITFRCNSTPQGDLAVSPNYDLKITPYTDMYLRVMYGNGNSTKVRAKAGIPYLIESNLTQTGDLQIVIYGANCIQELDDLSSCYMKSADFSQASKLKKLVIGNPTQGYQNSFLSEIGLGGGNTLLEYLDVRNCNGLTKISDDFPLLINLKTLLAEGTQIQSIKFAPNGNLETAHLPNTINSLEMRELKNLTDFQATLSRVQTLIIQEPVNTIETLALTNNLMNILTTLNLYNINWTIDTSSFLNNILNKINYPYLAGTINILSSYSDRELALYKEKWPDLLINVDESNKIQEYLITFKDDQNNIVHTQYVQRGGYIDKTIIPVVTKQMTEEYVYNFNNWQYSGAGSYTINTQIEMPMTFIANFSAEKRTYSVTYKIGTGAGSISFTKSDAPYGSYVYYTDFKDDERYKEIPVYPKDDSNTYVYLFKGWDQTGLVNGNKTINALFDKAEYSLEKARYEAKYNESTKKWNYVFTSNSNMFLKGLKPIEFYCQMLKGYDLIPVKTDDNESTLNVLFGDINSDKDANSNQNLGLKLNIPLGINYNFEDENFKEEIITQEIDKLYFNTAYTEKNNKKIQSYPQYKLFTDEDKDFTFIFDFQFLEGVTIGQTILSCGKGNSTVFKIYRQSTSGNIVFSSGQQNITLLENSYCTHRDIIALRHRKGENYYYLYKSNLYSNSNPTEHMIAMPSLKDTYLYLGATLNDNGQIEDGLTPSIVHYGKIYYTDLGKEECLKHVKWVREELDMTLIGVNRYAIDKTYQLNEETISYYNYYTFIADTASSVYGIPWNASNTNVGGWSSSYLRTLLNDRMFKTFPIDWQQIIPAVSITSNIGGSSSNISNSFNHICVPSVIEILTPSDNIKSNVYEKEGKVYNGLVANIEKQAIKKPEGYISDMSSNGNGGYVYAYWTRTPEFSTNTGYIETIKPGVQDVSSTDDNGNAISIKKLYGVNLYSKSATSTIQWLRVMFSI